MLEHANSSATRPARVVLLGARGFVAPALAAALDEGGVDRLSLGSADMDLCDPASVRSLTEALRPGDAVVMAAALTPEKGRDAGTLIRNVRMAEHVAAALQARPAAHLVYLSSDAVYDPQAAVVSEATAAAPADLYGLMHRAREIALRDASDRAGVPFCVLRPCAIYGPGDTHNSYGPNRFVRTALTEARIQIFGRGEETRDHVYIADVVRLIQEVLFSRSTGVLNLVSGTTVSFGDLAAEVVRLTGGAAAIESLPRGSPVTHRAFDTAALRRSFPDHVPTPLGDGLRGTVEAFPGAR